MSELPCCPEYFPESGILHSSRTYNCQRQAFYHTELREAQIADMAVLRGYRPTMFFRLLPDICSRGHLTCFRKTVKQLELSGSEDWYMEKGEALSKERLMKLWLALNVDHREV